MSNYMAFVGSRTYEGAMFDALNEIDLEVAEVLMAKPNEKYGTHTTPYNIKWMGNIIWDTEKSEFVEQLREQGEEIAILRAPTPELLLQAVREFHFQRQENTDET